MFRFLLLTFVLLSACQSKNQKNAETSSDSETEIVLVDLEGNSVAVDSKITILNLWATWCKPCIAEMPDLAEMQKQLPPEVTLLLASDEPLERQLRFIINQTLDLEFVQITSSLQDLGIYALPTTLIIAEDGEILKTMVGARAWNTQEQIGDILTFLK